MNFPKKNLFIIAVAVIAAGAGFAAGAAANLSPKEAREALASIPGFEFDSKLIRLKRVIPGTSGAVAEAQIDTAFRLEKKDKWRVVELRLGDNRWEDIDLITEAVRNEKIKRTQDRMRALSEAIASYREERQYYPRSRDIVELTDELAPRYMNTVIRADLWAHYLLYSSDGKTYSLLSLGPDGKADTKDEIKFENGKLTN